MARMHNPPHPGETLLEDVLPALGLTVTQAAQELGINRVTLSRIVNGKAGISVDLALRLEAWLDGPSAESWLKGQSLLLICGKPGSMVKQKWLFVTR